MIETTGAGAIDSGSVVKLLDARLREAASLARAANEKRYLKTDYVHLGVSVPIMRAQARRFNRVHSEISRVELIKLIEDLWRQGIYELRKLAVCILAGRVDLLLPSDTAAVEALLGDSHTWALVDDLSLNVAAPLLETVAGASRIRARWSRDPNLWIRRAAVLSLLPGLRRGTSGWGEFAGYADAMLGEKEFFLRKAIGWILREVSKHSPSLVADWLEPRVCEASAVTYREAVKYLPQDRAKQLGEIRTGR